MLEAAKVNRQCLAVKVSVAPGRTVSQNGTTWCTPRCSGQRGSYRAQILPGKHTQRMFDKGVSNLVLT